MDTENTPAPAWPRIADRHPAPFTGPSHPSPDYPGRASLGNARGCGGALVVLGILNSIGGIIVGLRIKQTTIDAFGDATSKISPTGWAFITNAVAVGLILVLVGAAIMAFANAAMARSRATS